MTRVTIKLMLSHPCYSICSLIVFMLTLSISFPSQDQFQDVLCHYLISLFFPPLMRHWARLSDVCLPSLYERLQHLFRLCWFISWCINKLSPDFFLGCVISVTNPATPRGACYYPSTLFLGIDHPTSCPLYLLCTACIVYCLHETQYCFSKELNFWFNNVRSEICFPEVTGAIFKHVK